MVSKCGKESSEAVTQSTINGERQRNMVKRKNYAVLNLPLYDLELDGRYGEFVWQVSASQQYRRPKKDEMNYDVHVPNWLTKL